MFAVVVVVVAVDGSVFTSFDGMGGGGARGVFFTFSQSANGMVVKWRRDDETLLVHYMLPQLREGERGLGVRHFHGKRDNTPTNTHTYLLIHKMRRVYILFSLPLLLIVFSLFTPPPKPQTFLILEESSRTVTHWYAYKNVSYPIRNSLPITYTISIIYTRLSSIRIFWT